MEVISPHPISSRRGCGGRKSPSPKGEGKEIPPVSPLKTSVKGAWKDNSLSLAIARQLPQGGSQGAYPPCRRAQRARRLSPLKTSVKGGGALPLSARHMKYCPAAMPRGGDRLKGFSMGAAHPLRGKARSNPLIHRKRSPFPQGGRQGFSMGAVHSPEGEGKINPPCRRARCARRLSPLKTSVKGGGKNSLSHFVTVSWRHQGSVPPSGTKSPLKWRFLSSRRAHSALR